MSASLEKNWTLEAEVLHNGVHILTTVLLVVGIASSLEMPLAQAAEAYAAMDTGKARYRMVLTV